MNKEEALKLINENDNEDWHVVPKTEHDTFLTNYKETEVSKGIKEHVSGVHQKYDDTIQSVLGKTKPVDVKTHVFLKEQLESMIGDIQSKESKISDLEKAVNDKSGDEALKLVKSDLAALKAKHQNTLDGYKAEKESYQSEIHKVKMKNQVDHSLMGIKFLSAIPEDARNAMIEVAKNDVVESASFLDGKAVFLDANGDPERDDQYNIVTIEARMKDKLKSIIDVGREQKGVKVEDPKKVKTEDGKEIIKVSIPDTVKDLEGLIDHLSAAGVVRTSSEYYPTLDHYAKELGFKV